MDSWRIVVTGISAQIEGARWETGNLLPIGRQKGSAILLDDPSVSRCHAEIRRTPQGWMIRDLGSTNGTSVNNVKLHHNSRRLELNDLIQCGKHFLRVAVLEEPNQDAQSQPQSSRFKHKSVPPRALQSGGSFLSVQACSQNTWEKALEMAAFAPDVKSSANQHLAVLLRTGYHLARIGSVDELLESILAEVVAVLDAQRGAILLRDSTSGQLQLRKSLLADPNLSSSGRCYSKTLVDRSFAQGESLLCQDTTHIDSLGTSSISQGAMNSIICALLRTPRDPIGVLHLDRGHGQKPFTHDDFHLADALAANMSVGIESVRLVEREREQFIQTVTALARTVDVRDRYTINHSQRVTDYAVLIAQAQGLSMAELHVLKVGTPLHDIGKIGVADAILRKNGKLTDLEFAEMQSHTIKGAAILEAIPALAPMLPIVRNHHERWDGSGYPDRLPAEEICSLARIVAVADAFDAMTSHRPYRRALPTDHAYRELRDKAGTHFDPRCVEAFFAQQKQVEAILARERLQHSPAAIALPAASALDLAELQPVGA